MKTLNIIKMGLFATLALYLLGKKRPSSSNDLVPRGVNHSIVPQTFLDKVQGNWDGHLFENQIIINDRDVVGLQQLNNRN